MTSKVETEYQAKLITKLERMFPGCVVIKNEPVKSFQGIPDLLVLFENMWAMLEVKKDSRSPSEPNQEYYVDMFNHMSFGAFIFPENEEDVLNALQSTFWARR